MFIKPIFISVQFVMEVIMRECRLFLINNRQESLYLQNVYLNATKMILLIIYKATLVFFLQVVIWYIFSVVLRCVINPQLIWQKDGRAEDALA